MRRTYSVTCSACGRTWHNVNEGDTVSVQFDAASRCYWHEIRPAPTPPPGQDQGGAE